MRFQMALGSIQLAACVALTIVALAMPNWTTTTALIAVIIWIGFTQFLERAKIDELEAIRVRLLRAETDVKHLDQKMNDLKFVASSRPQR